MDNNNKKLKNLRDIFRKATPVARRVAVKKMKNGMDFDDIKDEFCDIIRVESKIYDGIKSTVVQQINRHGLDEKTQVYYELFLSVKTFDKNQYKRLMCGLDCLYSELNRTILAIENYDEKAKLTVCMNNLQYLIAKITEFLKKCDDFAEKAFNQIMSGKQPDFDYWSSTILLEENLFEERKLFLKQTLHHLQTLEKSKCYLGVDALRLLLYHKEGCRRQKLYRKVEEKIISIYYNLKTEEERSQVYGEICQFVLEVVPMAGYISPIIIGFVFDRGFLSNKSRDMLIKIKPTVESISMTSIITIPLQEFYDKAIFHMKEGIFDASDSNTLAVYEAYKGELPSLIKKNWEQWKKKNA